MMNAYAWSSFITFILVFSLGVGVFLSLPEGKVNRRLALFAASIAVWSSGRVLYLTHSDYESALFWARFTISGTVFIPAFFLHFVANFLKAKIPKRLFASYAVSFILFAANFTPWMVKDVSIRYQSSYFIDPGPLYFTILLLFAYDLAIGFYLLRKRYDLSSGLEKNQIRFVFWSTLVGFVGGTTNFLADYGVDIDSLSAYATYLVPFFAVILTYAIFRYHLLDIEIVVQKGLVYLLTLIATAIPFFLLTLFFQEVLSLKAANMATFFLFVAILFIFSNLKPLTQQWVERSIFHERYKHYRSIHEFSQSIVRFLHLEDLTEKLFFVLTKTLHPKSISIFLSDEKGNFRLYRALDRKERSMDVLLPADHPLIVDLELQKKILVREEINRIEDVSGTAQQLRDLQVDLCLPFIFENRLIGICMLGPKHTGRSYSRSELWMLQTLTANASIAFENARLFKEVGRYTQQFNAISQAINLSPDIDRIFDLLTKEIQKYTVFDWASIAIYKEEGEVYFYRVKGKRGGALPENYTWPLTDLNVLSRLAMRQEALIQPDLWSEAAPEQEKKLVKKGIRSYVILPMRVRGKLIGTLNLWSPRPIEHPAQTLEFIVPLTNHLAPFLEVARLFEEMKKANQALKQKGLELEESQSKQARFFSFVTHELRTPLNSVIGFLSLLLNGIYGPLDPKHKLPIVRAKENSMILNQLINKVLDLARLESDQVGLQLEEVNIEHFLREMLPSFDPLLLQKGIQVRLEADPQRGFYTDRLKLRQVVENLLSNAIKFTEAGVILIRARYSPETDSVLIEVEDSGKGISDRDLPHIFEPFWQGESRGPGQAQAGSGLGLAIVKKTVEVLKGNITVSSAQGEGTKFSLLFPRRYPEDRLKTA